MAASIYTVSKFVLQSGITLKKVKIAYKTYGQLNAAKSNVIVYPTWFTGFIENNTWLIGKDKTLNPEKYFIIVVCALGNGQSTSPSNTHVAGGGSFPHISLYDNVTLQHLFITDFFKIKKIKLVVGWSMGAQQTYQWGCLYPDMVEHIAPLCGSAKTSPHNFVFLEGVKAALLSSSDTEKCLKTAARVYAGWGFSQPFYKKELWRSLGFQTLEDFLVGFWEHFFLQRDVRNVLAMLDTWQYADISANHIFNGDLKAALGAITAKSLVMPAKMDLYFPVKDNQWEIKQMTNVELLVIPGIWGHFAADGLNEKDTKFIDDALRKLLL